MEAGRAALGGEEASGAAAVGGAEAIRASNASRGHQAAAHPRMVGGAEGPAALRCVEVARRQPQLEPTRAPRVVVRGGASGAPALGGEEASGGATVGGAEASRPSEASRGHQAAMFTALVDFAEEPGSRVAEAKRKRSSCVASLPMEPQARPAPTTICDLSKDLLLEILLRLPSLPSLVRAALTCRAFLAAISSSPAFRRHFRALHPSPLLGIFFAPEGDENHTFTPIRRGSDRDHAAAVRGLDTFLTRIPHQDELFHGWEIVKCCGGCLLLFNWATMEIAVYNPLTGALDLIPEVPDEISKGHHGDFRKGDLFLVVPDDEAPDRRSFRVFSSCQDKSRVRVAVFSSATGKWHILPWSEPVERPPVRDKAWLLNEEQVNGFLCWSHEETAAYMVLLDTATLRFSVIDMPDGLSEHWTGNTKDGKLCTVAATDLDFTLAVWFRTPDADGVDKWVLQNILQLKEEVLKVIESSGDELDQLEVVAIQDGIVYMTPFGRCRDAEFAWYLSFCLETRKLEKLIYVKVGNAHPWITAHPCIMPWPASLVGSQMDRGEGDDTLGS